MPNYDEPDRFASIREELRDDLAAARAQLAAVTAQRDELLLVAVALADVCDVLAGLSLLFVP